MCGRYGLIDTDGLKDRFYTRNDLNLKPRYNIAPGQELPVVVNTGENTLELMKWGLIPFWGKDPKIGYKMINARAESVAGKTSFRKALQLHRCLVPASGFFEWKQVAGGKRAYYFHLKSSDLFAFAGLYDTWHDPAGKEVKTYTIITTEPNKTVAQVHNRMPVMLGKEQEATWLDPDITEPQRLLPLLIAYPDREMEAYPVGSLVNSPANDSPDLIKPYVQ